MEATGTRNATASAKSKLRTALRGFRFYAVAILVISGVVNLLALSGSLYMLQVYDRVLTSHSVPTLVVLSALVVGLYAIQGVLDVLRSQVLIRLGARLDRRLSPLAHQAVLRSPLGGNTSTTAMQPLRDTDTIRTFFSHNGPVAVFDLPWAPMYLAFVFFLHPYLGLFATGGLAVIIVLAVITNWRSGQLNFRVEQANTHRLAIANANARNAEVVHAMGFADRVAARFDAANHEYRELKTRGTDQTGTLGGISKVLRMIIQSSILGLGAYLVIQGEMTAGAIIAASIAATRALAPFEVAISQWPALIAARASFKALKATIEALPDATDPLKLTAPHQTVEIDNIFVASPNKSKLVLSGISFTAEAGSAVGIIGPSGSGKSSLARAMIGIWPLERGAVRLDGAALSRWSREDLGRYIGYLPQTVELFDVSVAENISCFDPNATDEKIQRAAETAGVHDFILNELGGYETLLGADVRTLSEGQKQRIGLARALYDNPFLVVLDEPNSNLDSDGESALAAAIASVRNRGGVALVIAHRPNVLAAVDKVAVIREGRLQAFGEKEEVLRKVLRQPRSSTTPSPSPSPSPRPDRPDRVKIPAE